MVPARSLVGCRDYIKCNDGFLSGEQSKYTQNTGIALLYSTLLDVALINSIETFRVFFVQYRQKTMIYKVTCYVGKELTRNLFHVQKKRFVQ
jgi:hypothetical protein